MTIDKHSVMVKLDSDRLVFHGRKGHLRCGVLSQDISHTIMLHVNENAITDKHGGMSCFVDAWEFAEMLLAKIHAVKAREAKKLKLLASEGEDVVS